MDLGQVFTNAEVAKFMASLFTLDKDSLILDPCFGEGAFLKAVLDQGFSHIEGYEIDARLFAHTAGQFPGLSLSCRDFLGIGNGKKYDGIIMNPPYIRQEKIDDLKGLGITKAKLRKSKIYAGLPSTANLYMYFILKAIHLLKAGGELVVIFPGSWMQARSGQQFRETLFLACTLEKQVFISGEIFEKDALVEVVILKLRKGKVSNKAGNGPEDKTENKAETFGKTKVSENILRIKMINGQLVEETVEAREEDFPFPISFHDYGSVRRGVTTGCNALYINPPLHQPESAGCLVPILSSPKDIMGYGTEGAKADRLLCLSGKGELTEEVRAYIEGWEKKICAEKAPRTLYEKIAAGKNWYGLNAVDSRGILFSYFVRNDMKFVWNEEGYPARDNFYIIKPKIDGYLLFALLNNYFTYYQLETSGKKYGAGLLKLQRYDIEALRFPDIEVFSDGDTWKLVEMAKCLVRTGNKDMVSGISRVIAGYSGWGYGKIEEKYHQIKESRLEVQNGIKGS